MIKAKAKHVSAEALSADCSIKNKEALLASSVDDIMSYLSLVWTKY